MTIATKTADPFDIFADFFSDSGWVQQSTSIHWM
jgi:hypothetical protein